MSEATALEYFRRAAEQVAAGEPPALQTNLPLVGTYCVVVPLELIAAAGGQPLRLDCGSNAAAQAAENLTARDTCSAVKASLGGPLRAGSPVRERLRGIILPATCDWKVRLAPLLPADVPRFVLDLVHDKSEPAARDAWRRQTERLAGFLEQALGQKITRSALRDAIDRYRAATLVARKLAESTIADPPPIRGSDLLLAFSMSHSDRVESWTDAAAQLLQEIRSHPEPVSAGPRILLAGSPVLWPNWKLPTLIEAAGGCLVAEELCSGHRSLYDVPVADEFTRQDMLNALADRYLLPCTCPCFTPNVDRVQRLFAMIDKFRIAGIVYHVLRNCFVYDMELRRIEQAAASRSVPLLRVESDYSDQDAEQIRTRLEAFVEMLR